MSSAGDITQQIRRLSLTDTQVQDGIDEPRGSVLLLTRDRESFMQSFVCGGQRFVPLSHGEGMRGAVRYGLPVPRFRGGFERAGVHRQCDLPLRRTQDDN